MIFFYQYNDVGTQVIGYITVCVVLCIMCVSVYMCGICTVLKKKSEMI